MIYLKNKKTCADAINDKSILSPNVTFCAENGQVLSKNIGLNVPLEIVADGDGRLKYNIPYIDLGLPSGTKWLKYNLGVDATKLNTASGWYGNYYQWGETTGYKDASGDKKFSWSDYSLVVRSVTGLTRDMDKDKEINGVYYDAYSNMTDTVYGFRNDYSFIFTYDEESNQMIPITDGGAKYSTRGITGVYYVDSTITSLDKEHDAVYKSYGEGYHIPTKAQIDELKTNTTPSLVEDYNGITGLNGMILTSTINGGKMFIPFSGAYKDGVNNKINELAGIISNQVNPIFTRTFYCLQPTIDGVVRSDEIDRAIGYVLRGVFNS